MSHESDESGRPLLEVGEMGEDVDPFSGKVVLRWSCAGESLEPDVGAWSVDGPAMISV